MQEKRGQAAMEFLMTYGWAILVVLAAIGALAYFGVLSPDRFLPSSCTIGQGFNCMEFKVNDGGPVQMRIRNNLGEDISQADVQLNGTGPNSGCNVEKNFGSTDNGADINGSLMDYSCSVSGDQFRGDVNIIYTRSGDTVNHSVSGSIVSEVE